MSSSTLNIEFVNNLKTDVKVEGLMLYSWMTWFIRNVSTSTRTFQMLFQIGPYFDTQILFRNMMAESRGLSKNGRPESTYQRRLTKLLEAHDEAVRSFFTFF